MENVILIGAITPSQTDVEITEYLNELKFLTYTAGGNVIKVFKQKIARINSKTFLKSLGLLDAFSKIEDLAILIVDFSVPKLTAEK